MIEKRGAFPDERRRLTYEERRRRDEGAVRGALGLLAWLAGALIAVSVAFWILGAIARWVAGG